MDALQHNCTEKDLAGYSPLAQLVALGREKSFLTLEDILLFFPKPEENLEQIDCVFATLISAGISFVDKDLKHQLKDEGNQPHNKA